MQDGASRLAHTLPRGSGLSQRPAKRKNQKIKIKSKKEKKGNEKKRGKKKEKGEINK